MELDDRSKVEIAQKYKAWNKSSPRKGLRFLLKHQLELGG